MPTLTTPSTATFLLQVDQILTLTSNFGVGRIVLLSQKGGDVVFNYTNNQLQNTPIFSSGSQGLVTITHLSGSLTYDVTASSFGQGLGVADTANVTLAASDDGSSRIPTGTLTYTINAATAWGLTPVPAGLLIYLPASGTISVAVSGGPTLNGGTTTLTRTLAANPSGVVALQRIQGTAAYGLTGV